MNESSLIKNAVQNIFYNDSLEYYNRTVVEDDEGGKSEELFNLIDTFYGNAQISNNELLKKEYGFEKKSDYTFTLSRQLEEGNFIKHGGKYYQLIKVMYFESHTMALGELYE